MMLLEYITTWCFDSTNCLYLYLMFSASVFDLRRELVFHDGGLDFNQSINALFHDGPKTSVAQKSAKKAQSRLSGNAGACGYSVRHCNWCIDTLIRHVFDSLIVSFCLPNEHTRIDSCTGKAGLFHCWQPLRTIKQISGISYWHFGLGYSVKIENKDIQTV